MRDVGRVMGMPYAEVDNIAKLIPQELNITLSKALTSEPELMKLYETNTQVKSLIDTAKRIEGMIRNASTHAAGVVITEKPLTEYIPLCRGSGNEVVSQYDMETIEKNGLLKMDFLGLKTLTVINDTTKIIERTRKTPLPIEKIPLDDKKTLDLLNQAETIGVFQLESPGMRDLSKRIGVDGINDIIALVALFRPGPMHMTDDFVDRKHGRVKVEYHHPSLEPILKDTYGIMLYQEQVMQVANTLAGFTLAQADSLRRIMGKKIPEKMAQQKDLFVNGAVQRGVQKATAEKVFEDMAYFAGYGFNKSHSAAYGYIAYVTAYLKANYPVEYMAALLTSELTNSDKLAKYIKECQRMGIGILAPDVTQSFSGFTVVGGDIRFGLAAIKNVGAGAAQSIIETRIRMNGFKSLFSFIEEIDARLVNRKILESLIKSGALDSFGYKRRQLFEAIDTLLSEAQQSSRDRQMGQGSLFDIFAQEDSSFKEKAIQLPDVEEWNRNEILEHEKELLGFYVTGHPMLKYKDLSELVSDSTTQGFAQLAANGTRGLCGVLHAIKKKTTKAKNERMATASLEDIEGTIELLFFPSTYNETAQLLSEGLLCYVEGEKSARDNATTLIVKRLIPMHELEGTIEGALTIYLNSRTRTEDVEAVKKLIDLSYKGIDKAAIGFSYKFEDGTTASISTSKKTALCQELVTHLKGLECVEKLSFTRQPAQETASSRR